MSSWSARRTGFSLQLLKNLKTQARQCSLVALSSFQRYKNGADFFKRPDCLVSPNLCPPENPVTSNSSVLLRKPFFGMLYGFI